MSTDSLATEGQDARHSSRDAWRNWTVVLVLQLGLVICVGLNAAITTYGHPSRPALSLLAPVCAALYQFWLISQIYRRQSDIAARIEQIGRLGEAYFMTWMVILFMYSAVLGLVKG